MKTILLLLLVASLLTPSSAFAVTYQNGQRFIFVADAKEPFIDIIDSLDDNKKVERLQTDFIADTVLATPYAPLLIYANSALKKLVIVNLKQRGLSKTLELQMKPQHLVLGTKGRFIGISNSDSGGFTLIDSYPLEVAWYKADFPATQKVLFYPNQKEIYYTNNKTKSLGVIDIEKQNYLEHPIFEDLVSNKTLSLSSPSRSLDSRKLYVSETRSGSSYVINALSREIKHVLRVGKQPVRPYSTPYGTFLYLFDQQSGHYQSFDQGHFSPYASTRFKHPANRVAIGRFDKLNLFVHTEHKQWSLFDNSSKQITHKGSFKGTPLNAIGSADGKKVYIAFKDLAELAIMELETAQIKYTPASDNGAAAFSLGLTNEVCH